MTPALVQVFETGSRLLARQALTDFVCQQAEITRRRVGFGWSPDAQAPDDLTALRAAVRTSRQTGQDLPVSSANNQSVIYLSPAANMAFRFWHDVQHVELGLSFGLVDELELALWHLTQLETGGFGPQSLPWQMLRADLLGQVHLLGLAKRFPGDQQRFVSGCLTLGYERGLLAEARRPT